jgi:hypothetical protein
MTEHEHSVPSPALVQHHLHGMHYPATRDDLINYARSQCKSGDHPDSECERVVQILSQLPDREYQRPTDVSKAFGELARNYLDRVSYPAGRDDLVASVREQGADDVVLGTIIMIPSQEYRNPDAVIVEIETSVLGATLASPMRTIALPSGGRIPVFGQGAAGAVSELWRALSAETAPRMRPTQHADQPAMSGQLAHKALCLERIPICPAGSQPHASGIAATRPVCAAVASSS